MEASIDGDNSKAKLKERKGTFESISGEGEDTGSIFLLSVQRKGDEDEKGKLFAKGVNHPTD